jgi:hypothetical protein
MKDKNDVAEFGVSGMQSPWSIMQFPTKIPGLHCIKVLGSKDFVLVKSMFLIKELQLQVIFNRRELLSIRLNISLKTIKSYQSKTVMTYIKQS